MASSRIGNVGCREATSSRSAPRCRCCQSGVRRPGVRRGSRSARAAASRNIVVNSAVAGQPRDDELLDLVGIEQQVLDRDPLLGLGQADRDAVVAPQHLDVEPVAFGQPALDRHRPRRVHPLAERREHAHPPVADLVGEPFDDDRAVVGDGAGRLALVVEVGREVLGGELVQAELGPQPLDGASCSDDESSRVATPIARPSSSGRPGLSPCQNGILPGSPGAGETTTRSSVMSSIRHDVAPSMNTSPRRLS